MAVIKTINFREFNSRFYTRWACNRKIVAGECFSYQLCKRRPLVIPVTADGAPA